MKLKIQTLYKTAWISLNTFLLSLFFVSPTLAQKSTTGSTANTTAGGVSGGLKTIGDIFPTIFGKQEWTLTVALEVILKLALFFALIVAIIFVVIGGFRYMTAQGSDTQAGDGRKTLTNALIGLVIIFLSYALVEILFKFLTTQVV